jgi:glutathione S-transferase
MAVKLHRCPVMWPKTDRHPCHRVQHALDEMGIDYEIVKEPWPNRWKRKAVIEATGQTSVPAIELEDGTWYREDSAAMAKAIRAGKLGGTAPDG